MKFLLLFLISFSTFAGYMSKVDIEDCEKNNRVFHLKSSTCIGECYSIPKGYQCEENSIQDELINDLDNPIYEAESNNIMCVDQETCEIELLVLICPSPEHQKIIELNYSQVYCTKLLGYEQKLSGNKVVKVDPAKKAIYDLAEAAKKVKEKEDKEAKKGAKDFFLNIDCSTLKAGFEENVCNFIKR